MEIAQGKILADLLTQTRYFPTYPSLLIDKESSFGPISRYKEEYKKEVQKLISQLKLPYTMKLAMATANPCKVCARPCLKNDIRVYSISSVTHKEVLKHYCCSIKCAKTDHRFTQSKMYYYLRNSTSS